MKKTTLVVTLGYPGSGKTYFSERLAKEKNWFHLNGDRVRLNMFLDPQYSREEHNAVYRFADYLAGEFLQQGVSVIYDANFNFKKSRKKAQKIAKKAGAEYKLVWIKTGEDLALKRLNSRAKLTSRKRKELYRPIDIKIFKELQKEIEVPTKSEKFIHIDGSRSFKEQLRSFQKQF